MSDPFRIFEAGRSKQETLKMLWPELYECLAKLDVPRAAVVVRCAVSTCAPGTRPGPAAFATARLTSGGAPACAHHVRLLADRPGGWPLRTEHR